MVIDFIGKCGINWWWKWPDGYTMLYQWNSRWLSSYTMKWWYFGVSELQQKKRVTSRDASSCEEDSANNMAMSKSSVKGHSRPNYNLFGSDGWDVGDIPPHVDHVDEVEAFEKLHPHSSEIDSNALGLCPAKDPKIVVFFWRGYGILGNLLGKHHLYQRFFLPCGRLPHGTAMDHTKWIRMVAKLLEVSW